MCLVFYNACLSCCSNDTCGKGAIWDCTCMPVTRASPNSLAGSVSASGGWVGAGGCGGVDGGGGELNTMLHSAPHTSTRVCHTSRTTRHQQQAPQASTCHQTSTHHLSPLITPTEQLSQDTCMRKGCVWRVEDWGKLSVAGGVSP